MEMMDVHKKRKAETVVELNEKRSKVENAVSQSNSEQNVPGLFKTYQMFLESHGVSQESDNDVYKEKWQTMKAKVDRDLEHIQKLHKYMDKQKHEADESKKIINNVHLLQKQIQENFSEIHEYQSNSYEQICVVKKRLDKIKKYIDNVAKEYDSLTSIEDSFKCKMNNKKEHLNKIQEENQSYEMQVNKCTKDLESRLEFYKQSIQNVDAEKSEIEKLMHNDGEKLLQEIEMKEKFKTDLAEINNMCNNLSLKKEKTCKDGENIIKNLQQDIKAKDDDISAIESRIEGVSNKNRDLTEKIQNNNIDFNKFNQLIVKTEQEIQELQADATTLETELSQKQENLTEASNRLNESNEMITSLNIELSNIVLENTSASDKIKNLEVTLHERAETVQNARKKLKSTHQSVDIDKDSIREFKKKLNNAQENIKKLSSDINKENCIQNSMDQELTQFQDKFESLQSILREKDEEKCALVEECEELITDTEAQNKLLEEINELKNNLSNIKLKINNINSVKKTEIAERKELNKRQEETAESLASLDKTAATLTKSLEDMKQNNSNLEGKLKQFQAEISKASKENEKLEESMSATRSEHQKMIDSLQADSKKLKISNDDLKNDMTEIESLKRELANEVTQFRELTEKLDKLSARKSALEKAEREFNEMKENIELEKKILTERTTLHKDLQKELTGQKKSLKECQTGTDESDEDYSRVAEQCKKLEDSWREQKEMVSLLENELAVLKEQTTKSRNVDVHEFTRESLVDSPSSDFKSWSFNTKFDEVITSKMNENILELIDNAIEGFNGGQPEQSNVKINVYQQHQIDRIQIAMPNEEEIQKVISQPFQTTTPKKSQETRDSIIKKSIKTNKFIKAADKNVQFSSPLVTGVSNFK